MAVRDELQKRIDKKRAEIAQLEAQLRDATVYLQALDDTLRILPKDAVAGEPAPPAGNLRPGSKVDKARDAIKAAGKALHVIELLKVIGIPNTPKSRAALAGSLSAYARRGEIFTRPVPNTFGVIDFGTKTPAKDAVGPPPNFGTDTKDEFDEIFSEEQVEGITNR